MFCRRLKSNAGGALIMSIITAGIVASISMIILQIAESNVRAMKAPRIKAAMAQLENKVRFVALKASSYTGCQPANLSGCSVISTKFTALSELFSLGSCEASVPFCGFVVAPPSFDYTSRTFRTTITYTGNDFSLRPVPVAVVIPSEIFHGNNVRCPDFAPFFLGFYPEGSPLAGTIRCRPVPNTNCADVQGYIRHVDKDTLDVKCGTLNVPISCPLTQFIGMFRWNGANDASGLPDFTSSCAPRVDPFAYFGFNPDPGITETPAAASPPDPDPGLPGNPGPITTSCP